MAGGGGEGEEGKEGLQIRGVQRAHISGVIRGGYAACLWWRGIFPGGRKG